MIPPRASLPCGRCPPLCGATPGGATSTPAVVIDLALVCDGSGPARLLDVASGRSKKVLKTWLAVRDELWKQAAQVVTIDSFTGFKSAAGSSGRSQGGGAGQMTGSTGPGTPYAPGPACSPTPRPSASRLCSADDRHAAVQAVWSVYQRPVPGLPHRGPGPRKVPDATAHRLPETSHPRRAGGDHDPGQDHDRKSCRHSWPTSTAPVPPTAPPRRSTGAWSTYAASPWDLRNLTHYTIRSLIHTGRLKDHLKATT